jgi:subtilisin family serine protease
MGNPESNWKSRFLSKLIWKHGCVNRAVSAAALILVLAMWLLPLPTLRGATPAAPKYRADQILILPKAGVNLSALAAFHAARGTRVKQTFANAGGAQVITMPVGETVAGLVAKYRQSGMVEFAEPDYYIYANTTLPNDPYFTNGLLWGLDNYGQSGGVAHADIDAIDGWDVLTSASNIVVAVLDSGIRATHQDLAANMWVNPHDGGNGYNAFTGTNNPNDDDGHGTLVAGVLGAVGNNGIGVCGVAWQVQLMACKSLNSNGIGSDSAVVACIEYALTNKARIINASFNSPSPSLAVSNAIVAAQAAGVIWVASAGNANPGVDIDLTPSYPSCYRLDNIVSVAYTTRTDALGSLSDYGATNVALAAPGDQIYSTINYSDTTYYPPGNLGINIAGTSFSAPYVSGACALLMAQYPSDNYHQTISRLLNSTDPLPALAGRCRTGGRLNLRKALRTILVTALPPTNLAPFQLRVAGGLNRTCTVEASPDLVNWSPVCTNTTTTNDTFIYADSQSGNLAQRFFRAIAAP